MCRMGWGGGPETSVSDDDADAVVHPGNVGQEAGVELVPRGRVRIPGSQCDELASLRNQRRARDGEEHGKMRKDSQEMSGGGVALWPVADGRDGECGGR